MLWFDKKSIFKVHTRFLESMKLQDCQYGFPKKNGNFNVSQFFFMFCFFRKKKIEDEKRNNRFFSFCLYLVLGIYNHFCWKLLIINYWKSLKKKFFFFFKLPFFKEDCAEDTAELLIIIKSRKFGKIKGKYFFSCSFGFFNKTWLKLISRFLKFTGVY